MQGPLRLASNSLRSAVIVLLSIGALGAVGCGRTELFGSRKRCAPTDTLCQSQVDGGIDTKLDMKPATDVRPDTTPDGGQDMKPIIDGGPDMKTDGPLTCVQMLEICNNGKDDNCNGLSDCDDTACMGDRMCVKPGVEVCNNNLDDDDDKLVDCADSDCKANIACRPTMGVEICDNGKDDNGDRLVDCSDPQCTKIPACLEVACTADVDFGTIQPHGDTQMRTLDTSDASRSFSTCATPGGVGRVGRFVLTQTTDVRLDITQAKGAAHSVSVFRAGASQACDRNPVGACLQLGDAPAGGRTFAALDAGTYWVVVQSYPKAQGTTLVTLSTGLVMKPEQCANGIDDDLNGLIDCQDTACRGAMNCAAVECKTDGNLGALVVGAPPKNARIDLSLGKEQFSPYCAGTTPGKAVALALTMPQSGGIEVDFTQTGATVIALFREPEPGFACDDVNADGGCQPADVRSGALAFQGVAAGRYILILKAMGPTREGVINLRVSAFANRDVEICGNEIDDDGDNLTDCDDPECFGIGMCGAPACMPEQNLGAISVGTMVSATVDTRDAPDFYNAGCGRGDGPERVLRFTVTQVMSLGVDCMGSGSHVLAISRQTSPLDRCDAHVDGKCADPDTLPFGCGYSIPGVQPGEYNFIVEAFRKGSEGVLALTLSGIGQTVGEVCDNGFDDDKDGFVDCMDRKCVTDIACEKFSCRADEELGILPLDGSVAPLVIGTAEAGDDQMQTPCVSASGGQDGVVDFQLPARANVTLEWAQVGSHAFALYSDVGNVFSCEAGTLFDCTAGGGKSTGTKTYANLPAGRYHLVIDADRPGSEGGVVIRLSGIAAP